MGEYGGESNAKKIARFRVWTTIKGGARQLLGKELGDCDIAVLSGPRGCDVLVAYTLGADARRITAIDINDESLCSAYDHLRSFDERLSGAVRWRSDSFERVLSAEKFDIAFIDSCSPILLLARKSIDSLMQNAMNNEGQTIHGDPRRGSVKSVRRAIVYVGGMYGRDGRFMNGGNGRPDEKRAHQFFREANDVANAVCAEFIPHRAYSYNSRRICDDGKVRGTPMLYAGGTVAYQDTGYAPDRRRRRQTKSATKKCLRDAKRHAAEHGVDLVDGAGHDLDGIKLRDEAIEMGRVCSRTAARLLCIPEGTVRAWLAHDTRGTYSNDH